MAWSPAVTSSSAGMLGKFGIDAAISVGASPVFAQYILFLRAVFMHLLLGSSPAIRAHPATAVYN